jgi:uncharacterized protein (DUF983 family)
MSTTTPTETTTKAARRGFKGLRCLHCGEADTVLVGLAELGFTCSACGEDFRASDVRAMLAAWADVLEWIDRAPTR